MPTSFLSADILITYPYSDTSSPHECLVHGPACINCISAINILNKGKASPSTVYTITWGNSATNYRTEAVEYANQLRFAEAVRQVIDV